MDIQGAIMREVLLGIVRQTLKDGYLSEDVLAIMEDIMKKYRPHKGDRTRDFPRPTNDPCLDID